ncbi:MAG: EamA family transporter [Planctomycetes bacterium]|nr:EamA family transporter [Planctomycetota bacterium]
MFKELTPLRARLLVVVAAVLWSLSGALAKLIALPGPTMACLRGLFAGLVLLPLLRPPAVSFRPAMLGMVACFATMNVCYVTAITLTTAANAIFLQYTAPVWMFLASVFLLGEPLDRRSLVSLLAGLVGIAVIVVGNWERASLGVVLGLVSGVTYGAVAVFLRVLRDEDPFWLTIVNHLVGGLVLLPVILTRREWSPLAITPTQLAGMALYGGVQMAVPYVLFARGLSVITPQEAGLIALLEPVLNPLLTFCAVGEKPAPSTLAGAKLS